MHASSPENTIQAAAVIEDGGPPEITTCVDFFDFDSEALRARSAPGNKTASYRGVAVASGETSRKLQDRTAVPRHGSARVVHLISSRRPDYRKGEKINGVRMGKGYIDI